MIDIQLIEIVGTKPAIKGMRNPMNSWDKSDSVYCEDIEKCSNCLAFSTEMGGCTFDYSVTDYIVGDRDLDLMNRLAKAGEEHAKYRRMINVYVDIKAPLYWWKEFDTYKVGTVANSCSTMHMLASRDLTIDDFSHEHLFADELAILEGVIDYINGDRKMYVEDKDKKYWWQMIQLLPSS